VRTSPFALLALLALSGPATARLAAQPAPWTLHSWSDALWLRTLDRDGAIGGRVGDPAPLRRYQPTIGRNYPTDLIHARGSATEDAAWHAGGNGLRYRTGSVDRRDLWWDATVRHGGTQGAWTGQVQVDIEQGPEARRTLPQLRAGRQLTPRVHAELLATLPRHKPDLDMGVALTWRPAAHTALRVETVALDPWTNYHYAARRGAFTGASVLGAADTAVRLRGAQPWATRLFAQVTPHRTLHIDLHAAQVAQTQLALVSADDPTQPFTDRSDGHFAGVVVGWQLHPRLRVGALGTTLRFDASRRSDAASLGTDPLRVRESQSALGLLAALHTEGPWSAEAVLLRETRGEVRSGAVVSDALDHRDQAWSGRATVTRRGSGRSAISGVLSTDLREVRARTGAVPARTPLDVRRLRVALEPAWRLGHATTLVTAVRYDADLDGLRPRWRDLAGFHARITTFW
jgi:hypothetical protein